MDKCGTPGKGVGFVSLERGWLHWLSGAPGILPALRHVANNFGDFVVDVLHRQPRSFVGIAAGCAEDSGLQSSGWGSMDAVGIHERSGRLSTRGVEGQHCRPAVEGS